MSMHGNEAAWVQGTLLVTVAAAVALTLAIRLRRPLDRDILAIQVAQLQSSAAEGRLLVDNASAGRLAPGFVRQHAQQMAEKVGTTNDKLQKPAQVGLAGQKAQAQKLGETLQRALFSLGHDGEPRRAFAFGRIADALDALDKQLKPDSH
jgi:hypothetical protein